MIEILAAIFGGIAFISFAIHTLSFYYLEISNDYDAYPYLKLNLELITYYDKKVKSRDMAIKRVCNITLILGGWGFAGGLVFVTILEFI